MAIKENKTRVNFIMEKEVKKQLEEQAKLEQRTTSNLLNKIITDYLNKQKTNKE